MEDFTSRLYEKIRNNILKEERATFQDSKLNELLKSIKLGQPDMVLKYITQIEAISMDKFLEFLDDLKVWIAVRNNKYAAAVFLVLFRSYLNLGIQLQERRINVNRDESQLLKNAFLENKKILYKALKLVSENNAKVFIMNLLESFFSKLDFSLDDLHDEGFSLQGILFEPEKFAIIFFKSYRPTSDIILNPENADKIIKLLRMGLEKENIRNFCVKYNISKYDVLHADIRIQMLYAFCVNDEPVYLLLDRPEAKHFLPPPEIEIFCRQMPNDNIDALHAFLSELAHRIIENDDAAAKIFFVMVYVMCIRQLENDSAYFRMSNVQLQNVIDNFESDIYLLSKAIQGHSEYYKSKLQHFSISENVTISTITKRFLRMKKNRFFTKFSNKWCLFRSFKFSYFAE